MHNVEIVKVGNSLQNLLYHIGCVPLWELSFRQYLIKKLTTFAKLSYNVVPLLICVNFVQLEDIGVIKLAQYCYFVLESLFLLWRHGVFTDKFNCSDYLRCPIDAFSNFSKGSRPKYSSNLVIFLELAMVFGDEHLFIDNDFLWSVNLSLRHVFLFCWSCILQLLQWKACSH